jgi:hypothetical protein
MANQAHEDFVKFMVEKGKKKEVANPQTRTGMKEGVNRQEVEDALKAIQEKIQRSKK